MGLRTSIFTRPYSIENSTYYYILPCHWQCSSWRVHMAFLVQAIVSKSKESCLFMIQMFKQFVVIELVLIFKVICKHPKCPDTFSKPLTEVLPPAVKGSMSTIWSSRSSGSDWSDIFWLDFVCGAFYTETLIPIGIRSECWNPIGKFLMQCVAFLSQIPKKSHSDSNQIPIRIFESYGNPSDSED